MDFDFALNGAWATDSDGFDFDITKMASAKGDDGVFEDFASERYLMPRMYEAVAKKPVLYDKALDFADSFSFRPGYRAMCFVSGNFILGDLIEALVERGKLDVRRMTIQTLSMSEENIDSLWNVCDMSPGLESLRIALSGYFWATEHRKGNLVEYLYEQLDQGDVLDVAFADIHTKIVSIETTRGNHMVMHGSANLRSSRSIEQLMVECDDELYACVEDFADRVFASYSTIDKSGSKSAARGMRAAKLWRWIKEADDGQLHEAT